MKPSFLVLILCALASMAAPVPAHAQNSAAEAEQAFRDAKRLMKEGKYDEACSAFETSNRLDLALTTVANLGDCREKNEQFASAWSAFLEVERQTRNDNSQAPLNKTAKVRAAALEKRLSYLTVSVPDESRVDGLEILRDGAPFDEGLWNRAIPIDGGSYAIVGRAPGHEEWSTTVVVPNENGHVTADVPKFKDVEKLVAGASGSELQAPDEPMDDRPVSSFTGRRKVALGLAGGGVIAVAAGALFGLQANGYQDDARDLCPEAACARNAEANELLDQGQSRALLANISYGVGAAVIIGAAVLWFTGAPESNESNASTISVVPRVGTSTGVDFNVRF